MIIGAGNGVTVSVSVLAPVPLALLARSEMANVPAVDGTPEITPVVVSTVRPVGSPMAAKLVGLLVAVIW